MFQWLFASTALLTLTACSSPQVHSDTSSNDPYLWLEEIESPRSLEWVKKQNEPTLQHLESRKNFKRILSDVRNVVLAQDRIPVGQYTQGFVYNFWQDKRHVRGLWRRTTLREYKKSSPRWEVLLDLDKLATSEKENWVWKNAYFSPDSTRAMLELSRGGKDAAVLREFNLESKSFETNGFIVNEAKSEVAWIDRNTLLFATDTGAGTLTKAGYPREGRMWKRGQPIEQAKSLLEIPETHMGVFLTNIDLPEGNLSFVIDAKDFFTSKVYLLQNEILMEVPLPADARFLGVYKNQVLFSPRTPWKGLNAGSVASIPLHQMDPQPLLIFAPNSRQGFTNLEVLKDSVVLNILDNVNGKLLRAELRNNSWTTRPLPSPENANITLLESDSKENILLTLVADFLTPTSVFGLENDSDLTIYQKGKARFNSSGKIVEQFEATSQDGTRVPYFVIREKAKRVPAPTLLYGYGGFQLARTPYYLGTIGKSWLPHGIYVLANIRGGGEFGPEWHQAALKENREKSFEDFIAVAEDLITRGLTTPNQLAIQGGSNGGLLVGATMLKRPDLFKAVVCQVPLLDMLRYHKLLAGASWMGEYGDPEDPKMRAVLERYSPYQNVRKDQQLPEVFFATSTKDDRVHPGHARKMAARMKEQGHKFLYFENIEGGHSAAANLEQRAKEIALVYTFLTDRLK